MALIGSLVTNVTANVDPFKKGMHSARTSLGKFKRQMESTGVSVGGLQATYKQLALGAVAATAAITTLGVQAVKAFSRLDEQTAKLNTVFSSVKQSAKDSARELADSYGLSNREARQLLGSTGDILVGFGFAEKSALDLSTQVNKLAVDLASFQNLEGGAERASQAITKALLGERESLKSLGVSILDADVKQRLFEKGQDSLTGALLRAAKAQATYELILEQTVKAQGDFARTSDSVANSSRVLSAEFENLMATSGGALEPVAKLAIVLGTRLVRGTERAIKGIRAFGFEINALFGGKNMNDILAESEKLNLRIEEIRRSMEGAGSPAAEIPAPITSATIKEFEAAAKQVITSTRTPLEKFNDEMHRLTLLKDLDLIDGETLIRAARELKNAFAEANAAKGGGIFGALSGKLSSIKGKIKESVGGAIDEAREKARLLAKNLEDKLEAIRQRAKEVREAGKSIFDETRTPLERFKIEMEELKKLLAEGAFDDFGGLETFQRKVELLKERLKKELEQGKKKERKKAETEFKTVDLKNISLKAPSKKPGKKTDEKTLEENKKQTSFLMAIAAQGVPGRGTARAS